MLCGVAGAEKRKEDETTLVFRWAVGVVVMIGLGVGCASATPRPSESPLATTAVPTKAPAAAAPTAGPGAPTAPAATPKPPTPTPAPIYMSMEPHDFYGGSASLHIALAIHNCDYFHQAFPEGRWDVGAFPGVYEDPIRIDSEGYVRALKKPGLSFGINLKEADKVTVERVKI